MSANQTYISKKYINKKEILKSIEEIALKQGFRVEKENVYLEKDIDIIIDPQNDEDDLVYRSSIRINSKEDFYNNSDIYLSGELYHILIYTNEMYDDNRDYRYFNHFIKEFLQLYPDILVDDGCGENFMSIQDILNQEEKVPSWMLMY